MTHSLRPTLRKQLTGAGISALAAIVVYQAYTFISPSLSALLPQEGVAAEQQYTDEDRARKQEEIVVRTREILQRLSTEMAYPDA
jgi:hypothetical protein